MIKAAADIFFASREEMGVVLDGKKVTYPNILKEFLNRCEELGTIRNNIIHGRVYLDPAKDQYIVAPHLHDSRYRIDRDADFIYSFADIEAFARVFQSRSRFIDIMAMEVRAEHERAQNKSPEEPGPGT